MMKLSSSLDFCVFTELLLSEGSLITVDVTLDIEDGVDGGSNLIWE